MAEKAMTRKEALTIAIEMLSMDEQTAETAEVLEILGKMLAAVSKTRKTTKSTNPEAAARQAEVMKFFEGVETGQAFMGSEVYEALVEADAEKAEELGFTSRKTTGAIVSLVKQGKLQSKHDEKTGKNVYFA